MANAVPTPKTVSELLRIAARKGKDLSFAAGADSSDRPSGGKSVVDISQISGMSDVLAKNGKVTLGTGLSLGRLSREVTGDNGILRQAAALVTNPLTRNRVPLVEALDPASPYFDITTPLVLLNATVRLQSPTGKRTLPICDFLDQAAKGLKKGELPVAVEFATLPSTARAAFFRVTRTGGKGTVSAAAKVRLMRNVAMEPEVVVSSLTVIPLRSKAAEQEITKQVLSDETIKKAAAAAADEVSEYAEKPNPYERMLVEIAISRTLRDIADGGGKADA